MIEKRWYAPLLTALMVAEVLAGHIVGGTIVLAGGFWLHHILIENGDPKLYDLLPWRYVVDSADLTIMIALTVFGIIAIRRMEKEEA